MSDKTTTRPATAHIPPFGLRMQPDLKARVEESAKANGRSMNAEIVARLEDSFSAPLTKKDLNAEATALMAQLQEMLAKMNNKY